MSTGELLAQLVACSSLFGFFGLIGLMVVVGVRDSWHEMGKPARFASVIFSSLAIIPTLSFFGLVTCATVAELIGSISQ